MMRLQEEATAWEERRRYVGPPVEMVDVFTAIIVPLSADLCAAYVAVACVAEWCVPSWYSSLRKKGWPPPQRRMVVVVDRCEMAGCRLLAWASQRR